MLYGGTDAVVIAESSIEASGIQPYKVGGPRLEI